MSISTELKDILGTNGQKKYYFVRWYVDSDRSKKSYDADAKYNIGTEFDTVMNEWILEDKIQKAIKFYMEKQKNIRMLEIYNSMLKKAIGGDTKSAEWVEKFYKSDFFKNKSDEIDDFLTGIDIPSLKKGE